ARSRSLTMTPTTARIARYLVLVGLPVLAILLALHQGAMLGPGLRPGGPRDVTAPAGESPLAPALLLLVQLLVILVVARVCGLLVRRAGQPQVGREDLRGLPLG